MQMRFSSFLSSRERSVLFLSLSSLRARDFSRGWWRDMVRIGEEIFKGWLIFFFSFLLFRIIDDKMEARDKSIILFSKARATNRIIRFVAVW